MYFLGYFEGCYVSYPVGGQVFPKNSIPIALYWDTKFLRILFMCFLLTDLTPPPPIPEKALSLG